MPRGFFSGAEFQMVAPPSVIPQCGACKLYKGCNSPKMEPSGNGKRKVLIVGEAPGEEEDRKGTQLVGKSGKLLERELRKIGVNMREDCWLTNALICRPPNNDVGDEKRIDYCRPNLLTTINRLKPNVIILLGGRAVSSLIHHCWGPEQVKIKRWAGWQVPAHKVNAWVCPTWHPSYLLREENPVLDGYFLEHLKAAFQFDEKPFDVVPDYAKEVKVLYDPEEVAARLDKVRSGVIAFDYEANMLKPESSKANIICCSVCWKGKVIAFPMNSKLMPSFRRMLEDPNVRKIASNMKYEDRWTRKVLGFKVRGWWWDTMLAAHLLDCRRGITSIKFQSFVKLGQPDYNRFIHPYLTTDSANSPNRITELSIAKLLTYNGLDSLLEYKVADIQRKEMNLSGIDES